MRVLSALASLLCTSVVVSGSSIVPVDPKSNSVDSFLSWFKEIGGKARKISLVNFDGMGNGLVALKKIKEGDQVISVPLDYVIHRGTLMKQPLKFRNVWSKFDEGEEEEMVSIFLMQQLAMGKDSSWHPYIQVLPSSLPLPHTRSDKDLEALHITSMILQGTKRREEMRRIYMALRDRLESLFIDVDKEARVKFNNFETFLWANSMVSSRALTIKGKKFLVPLSDMFNYEPQADKRAADGGMNFLKYHRIEEDRFNIYADRPTEKGKQLFEDYGDNPNSVYLNYHGFIPDVNPFDCADVVLDYKNDAVKDKRSRLLSSLRLTVPTTKCISSKDQLPFPTVVLASVLEMKEEDIDSCIEVFHGNNNQWSEETVRQCIKGNHRAYDYFYSVVSQMIKGFPTSEAEDAAILRQAASKSSSIKVTLSDWDTLAVRYRLSQKRLLGDILVKLKPSKHEHLPAEAIGIPTREMEVQERYQSLVDALNNWVDEHNPPVNKIKAAYIPGFRLGAVASAPINKEEAYLSVPQALLMNVESAEKCDVIGPVLSELMKLYGRSDDFHAMVFHLIYEKFQREKSYWTPYLNTLPTAADTHFPVFWSEEELNELQNSRIKPHIIDYRSRIERKYEGLSKHIFPQWKDIFTPSVFSYENYLWATAIMDSRGIWWGNGRHLVPLLDLINCNEEGPDPKRVHATRLDASGVNAVTLADRDYHAGDQIFENYGQPNWIYLTYHGFILDKNTHDCVQIALSLGDVSGRETKLKRLHAKNVDDGENLCIKVSDPIPPKLFAFVSIKDNISSSDVPSLEEGVRKYLKSILDGYDTTLQEDDLLLQKQVLVSQPHKHTALRLRMQEKRQLHEVIDRLSSTRGNTEDKEL